MEWQLTQKTFQPRGDHHSSGEKAMCPRMTGLARMGFLGTEATRAEASKGQGGHAGASAFEPPPKKAKVDIHRPLINIFLWLKAL